MPPIGIMPIRVNRLKNRQEKRTGESFTTACCEISLQTWSIDAKTHRGDIRSLSRLVKAQRFDPALTGSR